MTLSVEDDFAFLAVVDAYRWWINHDFGFLQATKMIAADGKRTGRAVGEYDLQTMRRIARAYSVSRNIPSHDSEVEGAKVVEHLNGDELKGFSGLKFNERATKLVKFVNENPVALKASSGEEKQKRRALASALSKLTWFLNPEDWTIFDKYVSAAVSRCGGAGVGLMEKFYEDLSKEWSGTLNGIEEELKHRGFDCWLASRIVDKYLFYHGVGMFETSADGKQRIAEKATLTEKLQRPAVESMRHSLKASAQVLRGHLGSKLEDLAIAVAPILKSANWTKDPQ